MHSPILLIPGFGDDASVFAPLMATDFARSRPLIPLTLPGFGVPALEGRTTLRRLARLVDATARREGAHIAIAHLASSIIASLAAARSGAALDTIVSLEGNLTAGDAYFSGTAADYSTPVAFHEALLSRLDVLAKDATAVLRYQDAVRRADPAALWDLGRDVLRFSLACIPGDLLLRVRRAVYFCNPDNLCAESRRWLEHSGLERIPLQGATHWKVFDQPDMLAAVLSERLASAGRV